MVPILACKSVHVSPVYFHKKEQSCIAITVPFNDVVLVVTGTSCSRMEVRRESDFKLNLDSKENNIFPHCSDALISQFTYSKISAGENA
ncbi:hypothetical protein TNCV_1253151 [Trichonephila clavipes]|nr:hypothetical protein TNCV_1253151 [Trichonephila clavipes]